MVQRTWLITGVSSGFGREMAQQLLRGGPLPPIVRDPEKKNKWIFDYPMLLKFGIAPSSLPKDSIMLNKPPSLYETNPLLFWGLVCVGVSGMLIIASLACSIRLLRKRNAKLFEAELAAREAKDRIQKIIESAPIFYALHVDGFVVENNGYHRNFVGTRVGDDIRRTEFNAYLTEGSVRNARHGCERSAAVYLKISDSHQ